MLSLVHIMINIGKTTFYIIKLASYKLLLYNLICIPYSNQFNIHISFKLQGLFFVQCQKKKKKKSVVSASEALEEKNNILEISLGFLEIYFFLILRFFTAQRLFSGTWLTTCFQHQLALLHLLAQIFQQHLTSVDIAHHGILLEHLEFWVGLKIITLHCPKQSVLIFLIFMSSVQWALLLGSFFVPRLAKSAYCSWPQRLSNRAFATAIN